MVWYYFGKIRKIPPMYSSETSLSIPSWSRSRRRLSTCRFCASGLDQVREVLKKQKCIILTIDSWFKARSFRHDFHLYVEMVTLSQTIEVNNCLMQLNFGIEPDI